MIDNDIHVEELELICADSIRIAAQRWTPKTTHPSAHLRPKKRILCVHGVLDNCRSFYFLIPYLLSRMNQYYQIDVVALDLPGHGLSSHYSSDHVPNHEDFVYYIEEALSALKWDGKEPLTVIGHSLGSAILVVYAATFPERVEVFVNLDGFGPNYEPEDDLITVLRMHIDKRKKLNKRRQSNGVSENKIYPNFQAAVQARKQTALHSPGNQWLSHKAAIEIVQRAVRTVRDGDEAVQFRHDPRFMWPPLCPYTLEQAFVRFSSIRCPVYWLRAQNGWPFKKDILERAERLLQPEAVCILPGSHHFHADPETALQTAQEVEKCLMKGWNLSLKQQSKL